ncbi:EutP/PduV family microcompartment system protein [Clostridium aciditolerans]|uniref:EutP/PduV family microcompartment system protein n=1 Tax=Clostridium aciditolerans TaxID=339861 RepID=A0A934M3U5_9CLOT|nr:EutP/PduV family microcompartment system protein [Clostridium aciditolerans]MBI6871948.1 EutP/PduV family microcompartment system protein [Clostridium aciditolerans]
MKKIMLIGQVGCGKTSLTQALNNEKVEYKKTQAMEYSNLVIDTPGEYIENRNYYNALITEAVDADVIGLIQPCDKELSVFPPSFGSIFPKPVIGIITKVDLCDKDIKASEEYLIEAGAEEIFKVSVIENLGIENIKSYLHWNNS